MALANLTVLNETMRAVVWQGNAYSVGVVDLPRPTIINSTDAIVRMSTAAICGSDLHIYRGTQPGSPPPYTLGHEGVAEYLRIPHADDGLIPVPSFSYTNTTTNETVNLENDYVMLSDIFATGWAALDFAGFAAGDTVAVFGAGPVGLMAAYSAILRGASRIYSVDYVPERLALAGSIGAIPIDFRAADPVAQILAREPRGVTRSVDCVGYEQVNRNLTVQSDVITTNMLAVTAPGGGLGTVGVYNAASANSSTAPRAAAVRDPIPFSLASFFVGEYSWRAGPSNPMALAPRLVQLVASRRVAPGFIVEDEIGIEDAADAYARFERHETVKVVIKFGQ
ncbi:hypothetical protein LTR53_001977 [Teratosphaeriaceae sp. CCFEE 6253]|nr:hypothetical protein LTR53_001977 [Teratosphaeriaceae sp. CCFEE 6253]